VGALGSVFGIADGCTTLGLGSVRLYQLDAIDQSGFKTILDECGTRLLLSDWMRSPWHF
jgi:hypothetical protein